MTAALCDTDPPPEDQKGDQSVDLDGFENRLQYAFAHRELLTQSLQHSSYINEHQIPDQGSDLSGNERLEFLGDAVLDMVVSDLLMHRFPRLNEGRLSRMRASLVNETRLAQIARRLALGDVLFLGRGEILSGGRDKDSILADALEAVIAAVYLDGGFNAAFRLIEAHFSAMIAESQASRVDFKSCLQEIVYERYKVVPVYRLLTESGPDHDKIFQVELTFADLRILGSGRSKKRATQDAARKALSVINQPSS